MHINYFRKCSLYKLELNRNTELRADIRMNLEDLQGGINLSYEIHFFHFIYFHFILHTFFVLIRYCVCVCWI